MASSSKKIKLYANNPPRISKEDLFMIIALWMEDFVTHEEAEIDENINQVGAVLVSADDMIYAADCSREGVHAVARLLIKHPEKAKGSKIFMSRKPCHLCAKLLVQTEVQRVFYLPFYPEYYVSSNESKIDEVDEMFKSSSISASLFVFDIKKSVLEHEKLNRRSLRKCDINRNKSRIKRKFKLNQWKSDWLAKKRGEPCAKIKRELPWPIFDFGICRSVKNQFDDAIEWMARVIDASGRSLKGNFRYCPLLPKDIEFSSTSETQPLSNFDPTKESCQQKANHLMILASFLTRRTDDPKTGVGAVIVNSKMDILSFGWNGFPRRAVYGEFGRGSNSDKGVKSKIPYVLHAEQNALLMRNGQNVKDAILFVTKQPCNECTPLLAMEGIKTVVVGEEVKEDLPQKRLGYDKFIQKLKDKEFVCFESY